MDPFAAVGGMTMVFIILSVCCTLLFTAAAIAVPFLIIRRMNQNNQKKAEELMATGQPGEATILALQDTGMRVNDNPRVAIVMEVRIPGYAPYQVQKTITLPLINLSQVQVGSVVAVLADPSQPNNPDKVGLLLR